MRMSVLSTGRPQEPVTPSLLQVGSKKITPGAPSLKFGQITPRVPKTVFQKFTNHLSLPSPFAIAGENQLHLTYPAIILWRVLAANKRRKESSTKDWNEVREILVRDPVGLAFWILTCPIVQRMYIARQGQATKESLLNAKKLPEKGLSHFLAKINPIARYGLPSNQQVQDYKLLALDELRASGIQKTSAAYKTMESFYSHLEKKRNIASLLSLVLSIVTLGFGINMINFYLTHKNVALREAEERRKMEALSPASSTHSNKTIGSVAIPDANGFVSFV